MKKLKDLWLLFISMLKIGTFTFGGGYAMINLLEHEFVEKRKWITGEEYFDLVAIAESTPGPVAINCATYIGYKTHNFLGAVVATLAMCIPSFTIIYVISLFFNKFLENTYVAAAFRGIQICVLFLIVSAGVKMAKKVEKSVFNIAVFVVTLICMVLLSLFAVNFSSIFYILISGALGLFIYVIGYVKKRRQKSKTKGINEGVSANIAEGVNADENADNADNSEGNDNDLP